MEYKKTVEAVRKALLFGQVFRANIKGHIKFIAPSLLYQLKIIDSIRYIYLFPF